MHRIEDARANKTHIKGMQVIVLIAGVVTAFATTAAAFFMWKDWVLRSRPYITGRITYSDEQGQVLEVTIHPSQVPVRIDAVHVPGMLIAETAGEGDPITQEARVWPAHDPSPTPLPLDIALAPSSLSNRPAIFDIWICSNSSARSFRVAMISKRKILNVKYWLTVKANSTNA